MPTNPTPITALPAAPDRSDRATFSSRATAMFIALKDAFVSETNSVATTTYNNAVEAASSASAASSSASSAYTSASTATTKASEASSSASAAATSATTATGAANTATTKAAEATSSAASAAASAASIAGGPVASVNGRTGIVTGVQDLLVSGTNIKTINGQSVLGSGDLAAGGSGIIANPVVRTTTKTVSFGAAVGPVGKSVVLDADRELLIFGEGSNIHGVVYNKTTDTIGSPVLIRTGGTTFYFAALKSATNQAIVVSCEGTAFEAVVLSVSANTITVNTAATATISAAIQGWATNNSYFVQVGTSFVVGYTKSGVPTAFIRALSISGTTVTIGAETTTTATSSVQYAGLWTISSSVVLVLAVNSTTLYAIPYTVSGSTLSVGTQATTTASQNSLLKIFGTLTSGRLAVGYINSTTYGAIISVSGTTATISAVSISGSSDFTGCNHLIVGNQVIIGTGNNRYINILTDNSGTAVAGTAVDAGASGVLIPASSNSMSFVANVSYRVTISGNNPVLTHEQGGVINSDINGLSGYTVDFGNGYISQSAFYTSTKACGNPTYSFSVTQVLDNGDWKMCPSQAPATTLNPIRLSDSVKWYFNTANTSAVMLARFELQ